MRLSRASTLIKRSLSVGMGWMFSRCFSVSLVLYGTCTRNSPPIHPSSRSQSLRKGLVLLGRRWMGGFESVCLVLCLLFMGV